MHQARYASGEMLKLPRLRHVRQMKLMSQRQLAEAAGVSPSTVASLETGHAAQFETIKKLCGALGVEVKELVGEEA
jgi:transcriptional regulator with XRE-family HTH domain